MPVPGASWVQELGSQAAFHTPPTPGGALCCAEGVTRRPGDKSSHCGPGSTTCTVTHIISFRVFRSMNSFSVPHENEQTERPGGEETCLQSVSLGAAD